MCNNCCCQGKTGNGGYNNVIQLDIMHVLCFGFPILGSGTPSLLCTRPYLRHFIDTTDKDRDREGRKQLSPDKIYLDDHLELRNCTVSSCICEV